MSGRPSALCGRAQARCPRIGASATRGTKALASGQDPLDPRCGIRLAGEERRTDSGDSAERHEAEIHEVFDRGAVDRGLRRWPWRPDGGADLRLLEDVCRSVCELNLHDDAPAMPDRRPSAGRVDELGGPWTGRDEDGIGGERAAVDDHSDDSVAANVERGRAPEPDLDATAFGERGVCVGRRARLRRETRCPRGMPTIPARPPARSVRAPRRR